MTESLCLNARCRGDQEPRETRGDDHLCHVCTDRLRQRIAETPALVTWLAAHVEPGRRGETDTVSGGGFVAPIPVRADVLAVIGPASLHGTSGPDQNTLPNIPTELFTWCRVVAEERQLYGPARVDPGATSAFLLAHLEWIVTQQWCTELLDELTRMHATAYGLAPWSEGRHELPAPCPSCDLLALVRYDGAAHVECDMRVGGCGRQWAEQDYWTLVHVLASEHQEAS